MRRGTFSIVRAAAVCFLFAGPLAVADSDWPGFRGPNSDGSVPEATLFQGGPAALSVGWNVPLGSGYSALAVGDGIVATMFADGDSDYLGAFSIETGKESWRYRISDTYTGHDGSHDGPISTPAMADGRIYGLGAWGHLFAVDAGTGKEIWTTHLVDDLAADKPWYGFATSPLLVDGVVVVQLSQQPVDEDADADSEEAEGEEKKPHKAMAIAGIDAKNGKTLWIVGDDLIEYQSPIVATLDGQRQVVAAGKDRIQGLNPKNGKVLWSYEHNGDARAMGGLTIVPLIAGEGRIFLMNKIDSSVMLQVERKKKKWEISELWAGGAIVRSYVSPVYHDGYIYGMNNRIFTCMDAATGEFAWRSREPGDGFPTMIGDQLVMMTKPGSLHVIEASPTAYTEVAKLGLFDEHSWSEVAYAQGHLFARSMARLVRVDLETPSADADTATGTAGDLMTRFLDELEQATDKSAAIDAFLAHEDRAPIIENDGTVHFIYRGEAEDVGIVGDMIGFRREDPMTRVPDTDLFYYTTHLEPTAAVTYGFITDFGEPIPDPRNPNKATGGLFGDVSWFAMPAWDAPDFLEAGAGAGGRLETIEWQSSVLEDQTRTAQVYLPAGYDDGDARYPTVYVHFGKQALENAGMNNALDHLIGSRIQPLIAVFIHADEEDPSGDVQGEQYREMVATELLPTVDEKFRTVAEPGARASVGFGRSASAAVVLGFEHPELFRRVAGQSPMMGPSSIPDLETRGADVRPMVIYLDWGTYHMRSPHEAWSLVDNNRELWTALRAAGYRPAGGEAPEGVAWPIAAAHTDEMLAALFPLIHR